MKNKLPIIFEDENFIAINKPAGLLCIRDRFKAEIPNAHNILLQQYEEVYTIHRIDKNTSGVNLFAKTKAAHAFANDQFANHEVKKVYHVLVHGHTPNTGTIDYKIADDNAHAGRMMFSRTFGKEAITDFETLERFKPSISYVAAMPLTGRTHQIRVHFLAAGYPLLVDEFYSNQEAFYLSSVKPKYKIGKFTEDEKPLMSRLTLHAQRLELKNLDGTPLIVEAPLPKDFQAVLQQLRKL